MKISYLCTKRNAMFQEKVGIEIYLTLAEVKYFFGEGATHADYLMIPKGPPPKYQLYGRVTKTSSKKIKLDFGGLTGNRVQFDYVNLPYADDAIVCHIRIGARKFWGKDAKISRRYYYASPTEAERIPDGYQIKWPALRDRVRTAPKETNGHDDAWQEHAAPSVSILSPLATAWEIVQQGIRGGNFMIKLSSGEAFSLDGREELLKAEKITVYNPVR